MNGSVSVFELDEVSESRAASICYLLNQLSASSYLFTLKELTAIVESPATHLFIAECDGATVGMLTVGEYLAPTGRKMWIEDVVVDESFRGRSIGRMLVGYAIDFAEKSGGGTLMLTSRPSRVAANALYRSCGFEPKETNMYRMAIKGKL